MDSCLDFIRPCYVTLGPGYDFKLQPVIRLQIGRSGVVGNVELPLNYHFSQVHSYP